MTDDTKREIYDRVLVPNDELERIIVLREFNLELPSVGIDDAPYRCHRINLEWSKIIFGALDILCEIAVWKGLVDENYQGIQEVLKFMKGFECEEPMTFALRMNGCDLEYTNNGVDWSLVENWDLSACIASDTTIINLGDNITTIENDITNIENNITNINTETTLITQNINNIVEGVGGVICLGAHVVTVDGENNIVLPADGTQFEFFWIDYVVRRNNAATVTAMNIAINSDTTTANYESIEDNTTSRRVGTIAGTGGTTPTIARLQVTNANRNDVYKAIFGTGIRKTSGGSIVQADGGLIWKDNSVIEEIELSVADGFKAGSVFTLYGVGCQEIELDEEPAIGWTIELDFLTDEYDEVLTPIDCEWEGTNGYVGQAGISSGAEIAFDLLQSVNIVRIDVEYFIPSAMIGCDVSLLMTIPTAQTLVEDQSYPLDTDTMVADINETSQTWELSIEYTGGSSISEMQWRKIKFHGTGTIPSALVPYQI